MALLPWYWALDRGGHGPDWHFFATFADGPGLAQAVSRLLGPGFVRDVDFRDPGDAAGRRYLDRHTAERLADQRARGIVEPVYYLGEVQVADGALHVQHVLAGALYETSALIAGLLEQPGLGLGSWRVTYGGDAWGDVASGTGADALRRHLAGGTLPDRCRPAHG